MSGKCGSCDCADKSQCVKGNTFGMDIIETDKSYSETVLYAPATENNCKCKCGTICACIHCTCGK